MKLGKAHKLLIGTHSAESAAKTLQVSKSYALVILSRLKKQGYIKASGSPRRYTITTTKQRKRHPGVYDVLNKYNPIHVQVQSSTDHQVHTEYTVEDAIVEAHKRQSIRLLRATLRAYNGVTDWKKLYDLAKKQNVWPQVAAMYDLARKYVRVRKMPQRYQNTAKKRQTTQIKERTKVTKWSGGHAFPEIESKWGVTLPFNENDLTDL